MGKVLRKIYILCILISLKISAEILSDNIIGYTISLPNGWIRQIVDSTHHIFEDTTNKHRSVVGVKVYNFDEYQSSFTEKEWISLHFWMYYFLVSVDSTNVVLYFDTLVATEKNKKFTADIYTVFFDPEGTVGDIAEYIRYTATGNKGYEIYAIGPVSDVDSNLVDYVNLIDSLTVTTLKSKVKFNPFVHNKNSQERNISLIFSSEIDLLGRIIKSKKISPQFFISRENPTLLIKRVKKIKENKI